MRRILRILAWAGAGLLGVIALLAVAVVLIGGTESGRQWLADTIVEQISIPGETEVSLSRLDGPLPGTIVLHDVSVADGEGVWLTVERAMLDWNPLRLLSREFSVELLQADGVRVLRTPAPGEPDPAPSEPFRWPTLPVEVDVQKFLASVTLEEAVAGQAATLRAEGEARIAESGRTVAKLSVVRLDQAESRIAVDATYDPDTDILAVDAQAAEQAGGLISGTLGLDPPPPLTLGFTGEGPLANWSGRLEGSIGDQAEVAADVTIRRIEGQMELRIASSLRAPGFTPAAIEPLMQDGVELVFEGRTTGESSVRIETLSVKTSALDTRLSADLDLEAGTVAGDAEVVVTDGAALSVLTAPATVRGASLRAEFTGPLLQPSIDLEARAESVALDQGTLRDLGVDLQLQPTAPIDQGPLRTNFELAARIAEIEAEALPPGELAAPLTVTAAGELDMEQQTATLTSAEVTTPTVTASGSGAADLNTLSIDGSLRLVAESLAPLAPLLGAPITGSANIAADFSTTEQMAAVQANLEGELRDVQAEGLPLAALLGERTRLRGIVSTDAEGTKRAELEIEAAAGRVTASAAVPADNTTLDGTYRVAVPDLARVAEAAGLAASGELSLTGTLGGLVNDPAATASLEIARAAVSGQQLGTVRGQARVDSAVSAPNGRLEITASPPAGPVRLATSFATREGALQLDPLRITVAESTIAGALSAPLAGGPVTGSLSGDLERLGPLLAFAGMEGRGGGRVDLKLSAEDGNQALAATVGLRDVALRAADGSEGTMLAHADADARMVLESTPRGTVSLQAGGIAAGGAEVSALSVDVSGSLANAEIRIEAEGESVAPFTVLLAGNVAAAGEGYSLALQRLDATVSDERITLASPANLTWRPGDVEVSDLDLRLAGGSLAVEAELGADRFAGSVDVNRLPLSLARLFAPGQDVQGTVSGQARIAGSLAAPTATARLRFDDVRAAAAANVPPVDGDLRVDWQNGRLQTELSASGFSDRPMLARLATPLRLDAETMTPFIPEGGTLDGSVRWNGEVGPLFLLAPLDDQRLTGMAEIDLGIGGSISQPRLTGFVALTGGAYEHMTAGTIIRSLDVRVDADGRRLVLSRLSGNDGARGRLQGSGTLSLAEAMAGAEFTIEIDNFIAVRRDDVTAKIDADLAFARAETGTSLSGQVKVEEAEIRLVNQLPPSVVTLDVIERGGNVPQTVSVQSEETLQMPEGGSSAMELDLTISMPERVFVRGRGLDSEWSGEFRITGTAAEPQILGDLSSRRGRLSLLNQDFEIEPSTIHVSQGNRGEIILELDIRATADTGTITAVVEVTGTASDPKIQLSSTPELPQDEILARLLFGRTSADLTALEAVQLAAAVQELTGGGGPGLLDIGRRFIGVDVLRVTGGGDEGSGAAVQAGKYVTDEVYVGVEQGVGAGTGAATVEIEVLPNVSVTSKVGQSGDTNIGVKLQWDY